MELANQTGNGPSKNPALQARPSPSDSHFSSENPNRIPVQVVIMLDEEGKDYREKSELVTTYFFGTLPQEGQSMHWDVGSTEGERTLSDIQRGLFSAQMVVEEVSWDAGRTTRGSGDDLERVVASPFVYLRPKNLVALHEEFPSLGASAPDLEETKS